MIRESTTLDRSLIRFENLLPQGTAPAPVDPVRLTTTLYTAKRQNDENRSFEHRFFIYGCLTGIRNKDRNLGQGYHWMSTIDTRFWPESTEEKAVIENAFSNDPEGLQVIDSLTVLLLPAGKAKRVDNDIRQAGYRTNKFNWRQKSGFTDEKD